MGKIGTATWPPFTMLFQFVYVLSCLPLGVALDRAFAHLSFRMASAVLIALSGLSFSKLSTAQAAGTLLLGLISFRLGFSLRMVGLTGGIGTGKSTVAKRLQNQHKLPIIDADKLGHIVQEPGKRAYRKLVLHFGRSILQDRGEIDSPIDRQKLSSRVFGDENRKNRAVLNSITHPMIFVELLQQLLWTRFVQGSKHVLFDAPLLFESGPLVYLCSPIVVVACSAEVQLQRVTNRDKTSAEASQKRIQSQMPIEEKVRRASSVINNDGTLEQLHEQVDTLVRERQLHAYL